MVMDRKSYEKLIDDDIQWMVDVMQKTDNMYSLEAKHILECLKMMPKLMYEYYYKKA